MKNYLVPADLKLGDVPGGVLVCWSLNVSELGLVVRKVVMDVKWQFNCVSWSVQTWKYLL